LVWDSLSNTYNLSFFSGASGLDFLIKIPPKFIQEILYHMLPIVCNSV
jgi:hypothetical protein